MSVATDPRLPAEAAEYVEPIPEHLLAGLRLYATARVKTGGFLRAVLENDLSGAVARGDYQSLDYLVPLVLYVTHCLPAPCHGSAAAVADWLAGGEGLSW